MARDRAWRDPIASPQGTPQVSARGSRGRGVQAMTDTIGNETGIIPPLSRRTFFRITAAGAVVLTTGIRGSSVPAFANGEAHTVLPGADIPKFVTPLLVPPAMPRTISESLS